MKNISKSENKISALLVQKRETEVDTKLIKSLARSFIRSEPSAFQKSVDELRFMTNADYVAIRGLSNRHWNVHSGKFIGNESPRLETLSSRREKSLHRDVQTEELGSEVREILSLPLMDQGGQIGNLVGLIFKENREFTADDLNLFEAVADIVSPALECAMDPKKVREKFFHDFRWLSFIMDSIPTLVSYINRDGIYTYANRTYEEWFGRSLDTVVGKSFIDVLGADKYRIVEKFVVRALAGEVVEYDAFVHYEGGDKHVHATYLPDVSPSTDEVLGFIVMVQDITAPTLRMIEVSDSKKMLYDDFWNLSKAKSQAERAVSLFTHDMRSPLTGAKLSSEMLLRKPDDVEKVKRHAARIRVSLERTDRQIRNLLDANRLRSGRPLELNREEFTIGSEVEMILEEFQTLYGDRFEFVNEAPGLIVNSDKNALTRVLDILLTNAFKFGSNEKIRTELRTTATHFHLSVHNFGSYLSEEEIQKIFADGVNQDVESHEEKRGIGLSVVRGIVSSLDGTMEISSSREDGTTFELHLPKEFQTT